MDSIYGRMNDDTEPSSKENPKSEIQQFFSGKTVFLTGCTGFVGKCLVEKLLRTCSDMKRLYVLVRPKKDKSIEERMEHYFDNVIFQTLKNARPNFQKQVSIIEGDLSMPGIAISPDNRRILTETLDVIIHNAAIVIFSAKISTLLSTNVLGTKEMLDLATECHHLKGFMYVSTAYSHCYLKTIEEKFYKPPADLQVVRDMIKADKENEAGLSKESLETFLGPCPNPYIFTKAIAESIVQEYARKVSFPCGIFRMSIVISTYKEPIRSWCGNMNGPTFSLLASGLGIQHVVYIAKNGAPDLVPADMTANACLASVWDLAENKEGCIYNYGSSTQNPITYEMMRNNVKKYGKECPSIKTVGMFFVIFTSNYALFMMIHIFFHYFPAFLADIVRLLLLKKPKYIQMLIKMRKHMNELIYFVSNNWHIKTDEMTKVWDRLNPTDCKLFFCDIRKLDWEEYAMTYWHGLRVYLLKEPMDNMVVARRRYEILVAVEYTIIGVVLLLIGYFVFGRFTTLFG